MRGLSSSGSETLGAWETCLVRKERLELSRVSPLVPKTSASTNFATFARVKNSERGCVARRCGPGVRFSLKTLCRGGGPTMRHHYMVGPPRRTPRPAGLSSGPVYSREVR